jgi:hypothetical protein
VAQGEGDLACMKSEQTNSQLSSPKHASRMYNELIAKYPREAMGSTELFDLFADAVDLEP